MMATRSLLALLIASSLCLAADPAGDDKKHDDHAHHGYDPKPHNEFQDTNVHHKKEANHGHFWPLFEHLFTNEEFLFGKKAERPDTDDADLHGAVGIELPVIDLFGYPFKITKFMILEVIAALLVIIVYVPLAQSIKGGALPKGRWWNFFEVMLVFIRDEVARPSFGGGHAHHDEHKADAHGHGDAHGHDHSHAAHEEPVLGGHPADGYVPFLWTMFLFILFCNLLGMIPMMGSPTASIYTTIGLALISFFAIHIAVIQKTGISGFLRTLWPKVDMPPGLVFQIMGFFITLLLAVIEFVGLIIKSFVLAVRLFANMFAGHMVLGNILLFIVVVGKAFGPGPVWGGITLASVIGVVALSLLELFVAFLQAYIFTFLTALFMGMQLSHAEHH